MIRSHAIATTVVSAGIVTSLMIAGVAVVNATDADPAQATTPLVAQGEASPAPTLSVAPLPPLPVPPPAPSAGGVVPAGTPSAVTSISRTQARDAVTAQLPGQVLEVDRTTRGGYRAYAVRVRASDGSVVTGFVDRASGVVFDWVTVSGPKAAAVSDDDDAYESDDDAYESDDDAYESDDDSDDHAEYDDDDD